MIDTAILVEAEALLAACRARGVQLATAESCTGGLIAAALTAIAGSSDVVDRGFVIAAVGAVSQQVAGLMASGALAQSGAGIAVAVTGVAGPGGGSADKPVGLVWFGLAVRGGAVRTDHRVFPGDRTAIRAATVAHAFAMIRAAL